MFGRGFKIFTLFGIPVHLNWTFFVIVPLFAYLISGNFLFYADAVNLEAEAVELGGVVVTPDGPEITRWWLVFTFGVLMTIGLYLSVLIHEFGHALTGRLFGVETERVTLWFLGGVASFERMPRQPGAEAIVAIVGPLTSYALAGVLAVVFVVLPEQVPLMRLTIGSLAVLNIILATFNLIPALPLDGGRVLRSLLALAMPYVTATRVCSILAKVSAAGLVLLAILGGGNIMAILIAIFVWTAATAEMRQSQIDAMLAGLNVGDVMMRGVPGVPADLPVASLVEQMRQTGVPGFPVIDDARRVIAVVTVRELQEKPYDPSLPVSHYATAGCRHATPDEWAIDAFRRMTSRGHELCAVVDESGRLAGMVTRGILVNRMQEHLARRQYAELQPAPASGTPPVYEPYQTPRG
jgi:Zn-dependent protease